LTNSSKDRRFKILVCIDLLSESFRGLRYAVRLGSGPDADVTLLYVRKSDKGLRTGGLQMQLAHQNLLEWGLDLPGQKALKDARDFLIEMGFLQRDWLARTIHKDVIGDELGDNMVEYSSKDGRKITLKMKVASSVTKGILEECVQEAYDITVVNASEVGKDGETSGIEASAAHTLACEIGGPIIFARALEESHAHLLCVTESPSSIEAARKDAKIASRCFCPIFLYSVAENETRLENANNAVAMAKSAIEELGLAIAGEKVEVGDPISKILEEGRSYSLIVLSASEKVGLKRLFASSVASKVLGKSKNSVMIVR
jgi:nucleotide-binding universal stress UspA family protein